MKNKWIVSFARAAGFSLLAALFGDLPARAQSSVTAKKTLSAITIDGNLNESVWTGLTFTSVTQLV